MKIMKNEKHSFEEKFKTFLTITKTEWNKWKYIEKVRNSLLKLSWTGYMEKYTGMNI